MSGTRAYSGCSTLDRDAAPGRAPGRFVDGAHRALADQRDDRAPIEVQRRPRRVACDIGQPLREHLDHLRTQPRGGVFDFRERVHAVDQPLAPDRPL